MTTKEVAKICGVTERTVSGNAKKAGVVLENGKSHNWTEEELKRLQLVLMKNSISAGVQKTKESIVKSTVETISDIDGFKYSKKDICNICNVASTTFDRFVGSSSMTKRDFISIGSSHKKLYNENVLKKFQLWLMENQMSQGAQVETVKSTVVSSFKAGLTIQELIRSGNVEAIKEFTQMAIEAAEQQSVLIESQKQNKLLLEQKEKAEAETSRIYQYNKNFHSNLYTASDIAKKFGITPNMVGRIANENGLKQDPIYGKLGKVQLNNGKWVNQFYYNEDALTVIKSMVRKSANIIK